VAPNVEENILRKPALCCLDKMFLGHRRDPNGRVDPWKKDTELSMATKTCLGKEVAPGIISRYGVMNWQWGEEKTGRGGQHVLGTMNSCIYAHFLKLSQSTEYGVSKAECVLLQTKRKSGL